MSLKITTHQEIPTETIRVARAVFAKGNPYMLIRDELGSIFQDDQFSDLYSSRGQPGLPPWRLAMITIMQYMENLSDRQAADAVRARIDWKYILGLELTDQGFDYSILSEFRSRLIKGKAAQRLFDEILEQLR